MIKSAKKKRELKLITELCRDHRYMFARLNRKDERSTNLWKYDKKTGKSLLVPAVCIKLIVPINSASRQQIVELYKKQPRARRKMRSKKR